MPGLDEISRLGLGVDQRADGGAAVVSRNPRGGTRFIINRSSKSGGLGRVGVSAAQVGYLEFVKAVALHRHTHQTASMGNHEGDCLWGHLIGEIEEVSFVLASLIIYHDHEFAGRQVFQSLVQATQGHHSSGL